MLKKAGQISLAVYLVVFFGIVMPGHLPGLVSLDAKANSQTSASANDISIAGKPYCPLCFALSMPVEDGQAPSEPREPDSCALCHLKTQLSQVNSPVVLSLATERDLGELDPTPIVALRSQVDSLGLRDGRAPPVCDV